MGRLKTTKTYQDLIAIGEIEKDRIDFALQVIAEHKGTDAYKTAMDAALYYKHQNPTIMRYQKWVYNTMGKKVPDVWAANNKIPCRYYFYFVTQLVQYLLGNGVSFTADGTKKKLGADFDTKMQKLATNAQNGGVSFAYWNLDHVEVFDILEFAPLLDEETGAIMAGVRFWQIDAEKPLMFTLYEIDGVTEYRKSRDKDVEIVTEKRAYKQTAQITQADGVIAVEGENYPTFPIVPLYNIGHQSELIGSQNTLDAYDLMASALVNNVDDGNLIYWVIKNCGGMDLSDDAKFIEQLKMTHVAHADGDDGASVDAHTVEAPFEANEVALERLRKQLFDDFMALDVKQISAGATTATQINAAYEPLNNKADAFEYEVINCIQGILKLAGIEDTPTFTRSRIVNVQEEVQTVLQAAEYVDDEYMTKKILTLLGDGDKAKEVLDRLTADSANRFTPVEDGEE